MLKELKIDVEEMNGKERVKIGEVDVIHLDPNTDNWMADITKLIAFRSIAYIANCFNYGEDVKRRAHFKSSKSGVSREDKIARKYGFTSAEEMGKELAEWKAAKLGKESNETEVTPNEN